MSLAVAWKSQDAEDFDYEQLAQRFADSAPSLRSMSFSFASNKSFWGVERADDEDSVTLKQLTEDELKKLDISSKEFDSDP